MFTSPLSSSSLCQISPKKRGVRKKKGRDRRKREKKMIRLDLVYRVCYILCCCPPPSILPNQVCDQRLIGPNQTNPIEKHTHSQSQMSERACCAYLMTLCEKKKAGGHSNDGCYCAKRRRTWTKRKPYWQFFRQHTAQPTQLLVHSFRGAFGNPI